MAVTVRQAQHRDALPWLEVHRAAVHGIAAKDYSAQIIASWAPLPVTEGHVEHFLKTPDNEIRVVAEMNGELVGIGALIVEKSHLRACYVRPDASRQGIGTAIVRELERIALQHGIASLELHASVTSEPFYAALGYLVMERGEHILSSGQPMACVKMFKELQTAKWKT